MLSLLLRVKLRQSLWSLSGGSRKKKGRGSLVLLLFVLLYVAVVSGFLFWGIFGMLAESFALAGLVWLYYALVALMAFALMLVGSVFLAKSQLYDAKDNDLLLSLPIKPGHILFSRMLLLWLLGFALELVVAVPALITAPELSGAGLGIFLLLFFLLSLFTLAVSVLFGWLLSVIVNRLGGNSLLTVLLSLGFFGLYFAWIFRMNNMLSQLAEHPQGAAEALGAVAPLYWLGAAIEEGRWDLCAPVAALFLGAFALAGFILSKTFIRTATGRRSTKRKVYTGRAERLASPRRALFRRELRRLLSSPGYMLNGAMGGLLAILAAGALLFKDPELVSQPLFEGFAPLFQALALLAGCFCASSVILTAASVSLEGKTLWIVRSAPVETRDLLLAKLKLHLAVGLPPVLLLSLVSVWLLRPKGLLLPSLLLVPAAQVLFTGLLGLAENLRHPNFAWLNEIQAVKSGMSVMLTMFLSWGVLLLPVLVYALLRGTLGPGPIAAVFLAVLLAACLLLYRWIMTRGVAIFESLS